MLMRLIRFLLRRTCELFTGPLPDRKHAPPGAPPGPVVPWGGCEIPDRAPMYSASSLIIGSPGAGKTLLLRMLLGALLHVIGGRLARRFMMLDEKRDAVPILHGLGLDSSMYVIANPFDARCWRWDIAKDINTPGAARQAASTLIPNQKNSQNPFFDEAARAGLTVAIQALNATRPGEWDLLDLVRTMRSPKRLRPLLKQTDEGRDFVTTYLNIDPRTAANVMATVDARLAPFREVAVLWARAKNKFSVTDWARSTRPYGIILGADDEHSASLRPLAQVLFRRASDLATGRPEENPVDETVFVLDELTAAGKLDRLKTLCEKGRSKGVRVVAAFQDFDSFCSTQGSEAEGRAIAGLFGNLALLRLAGTGSMKWASELLGKYEARKTTHSTNFGENGQVTNGIQVSTEIKSIMEGSEFRQLPLASREHGITGVFATPGLGFWRGQVEPSFIAKWLKPKSNDPGFVPRDDEEQLPPPELEDPIRPFEPTDGAAPIPDLLEVVTEELGAAPSRRRLRTMDDGDE